MPLVKPARCLPGLIVILLLAAPDSYSQTSANRTSIGFAEPADTRALLAYRLPDWGYRTWELGFDLSGRGTDQATGEDRQYSNSFSTNLDTDFRFYQESERRTRNLDVFAGGDYQRSHNGSTLNESSGHALGGLLTAAGYWNEYLDGGPFLVGGAATVRQGYDERITEYRNGGEFDEDRNFSRRGRYDLTARIGWGRVRDVTPLIRAQRLSERLAALGRARLTMGQIQEVARVLAREEGYRTVFDRPERSFWDDVLAPMFAADQPLSTYEVFYLRDVLSENIGPRREGLAVTLSFAYGHNGENYSTNHYLTDERGPLLGISWVRNPNLNHQLTLSAQGRYRMLNYTRENSAEENVAGREDAFLGSVGIAHLWTLADRYRLDNHLSLQARYQESERDDLRSIRRNLFTSLGSSFRVFVEDNMSVVASIRGTNNQDNAEMTGGPADVIDERDARSWSWSYRVGLEYYLDRFLY